MDIRGRARVISMLRGCFSKHPQLSQQLLKTLPSTLHGIVFSQNWNYPAPQDNRSCPDYERLAASTNPLREYFEMHNAGRGIWKWEHYFDIYHRHFQKFVGYETHLLEVGIYSGGSLDMWKDYFGRKCRIYGADIEAACKSYEDDRTQVFIGDQANRGFWQEFKRQVPLIDIVIDDGGHTPEQQRITLEEMLPHIRPGGIYMCEDIHGTSNGFASYVRGLTDSLNAVEEMHKPSEPNNRVWVRATPFQSVIHSVHLYPFATVIEKNACSVNELVAPKHGTEWQPFL